MALDLMRLDREVARAAGAWRSAVHELRRHGPEALAAQAGAGSAPARVENPLDPWRRVSSRTTWLELSGRTPSIGAELGYVDSGSGAAGAPDPTGLAAPLAEWVHALTLERVLFVDRVRLAAAWYAPSVTVDAPEPVRASPREALLGLLAESTESGRRAFADALVRGAGPVADAARILAERRQEATRQLGVDDPRALEVPCEPAGAALEIADALLRRTDATLLRDREPAWDRAIDAAVGREAASGWPARLGSRWIEELFRPTKLTEGLEIALGPLPRPLGASSFARALARFGAALSLASSGSAAFSLAHPPFDLRRARRAALFGGLVADPVFCARALGLGQGRALDQARTTARAMLLSLRLVAAQVAFVHGTPDGSGHVLLLGAGARADRFEEQTARALGAPLPGALAGVIPALEPDAAVRLLGALLAARDRRALVERFDEDWFRNPRAAEAIRGEDSGAPASPRTNAADLEAGLDEMTRVIATL